MGEKDGLTPAEWKVMRIVWEQRECAARDVYERAGAEHGWSPSTVKTILRRLVEKKRLQTKQIGNSFLYRPTTSPLQSLKRAADDLLENVLEGTAGPLLSHILKKADLSPAELAELRALLKAKTEKDEESAS